VSIVCLKPEKHPAVGPVELRMLSRFETRLSASLQSSFRPRPGTGSPMHPATSVFHRRTEARMPGPCFRSASYTVVKIAGRITHCAASRARGVGFVPTLARGNTQAAGSFTWPAITALPPSLMLTRCTVTI
jgi:hypothetical protein